MKLPLLLKYFVTITLFLGITVVVSANGNNLWEHFGEQLPSISERAEIYGENFTETYTGTFDENISLLSYLHDDFLGALAFPPSTVEGTSTAGWTDDGSIVRLNTSSDFVGIGTTNPPQKLTVTGGNFRLEGDITLITGDISYIVGDISIGGGDINLGTGSATTTLTVTSVGLGMASSTPNEALSVSGSIYSSATTTGELAVVASTTQFSGGPVYNWPQVDGSDGQVLQTDGKGHFSFGTVAGVAKDFLISSSTSSTYKAVNTQTIIIGTLPGGALSTDGIVKGQLVISDIDWASGGSTQRFRLNYGGSVICSLTFSESGTGARTDWAGIIDFTLHGAGATNSQGAYCYGIFSTESGGDPSGSATGVGFTDVIMQTGNGTASIDSTVDKTLLMEITNNNNAGNEVTIIGASFILQYRTD